MSTSLAIKNVTWPAMLPFELALGIHSLEDILEGHGLSHFDWEMIEDNPLFKREVAAAMLEVAETGMSFKRKAAVQAETYLKDMDDLMASIDTAPSTKLEIFKTLVKCGDLEPKGEKQGSLAGQFNIQINF